MLYLDSFNFVSFNNDLDFQTGENCYNTKYPYGVLSYHHIEYIEFEPITIFYGGNGCGKTTALNIIAEKLHLKRDSLYNKSNFYDEYLSQCKYRARTIPFKSRIITSDDVFEFTMNLRHINEGIDRRREELFEEYERLKASDFKLKNLSDYEEFKNDCSAGNGGCRYSKRPTADLSAKIITVSYGTPLQRQEQAPCKHP